MVCLPEFSFSRHVQRFLLQVAYVEVASPEERPQ